MNKLVVTGVESVFTVFDMRTRHPTHGYASVTTRNRDGTTVWAVKHLPQNRDVFVTSSGAGGLNLYNNYPGNRVTQDPKDKQKMGVAGTVELLNNAIALAEQPISAFDWSPDKSGLCVFSAFDQQVRVAAVTRLPA
ncbi:Calcineurin subunit B type 2 [Entophlyctis luteolus]|nr:Calcineurin subunit B type 2 [Entophlyctis luteolus]